MKNKKIFYRALTILILLIVGSFVWKLLTDKPGPIKSEPHSYFICPDGSQHGPGVPGEGVQEWCKKYGFVISEGNTATPDENNKGGTTEAVITVSGYVVNGGDTTPEGLFDTPRKFVYTIQKDDGSTIGVSYTAYPPSPVGDREMKKIKLNFHAGTIKIGDYLKARGTYDTKTNVLTVINQGDYIETYSEKQ